MNWSLKLKEVNNRFRIQNLVTNQDIWWTSTINNELHTCKTHLFTYTFKIYHIIKTLARRWQITGREWCTGFFFFFVVSDEKNLERDELCNRQRSYHFPLFLVVISITLKKKTTKKAVPRLWSFLYLGGKTLTTESWTIKIIKQMISLPIKQWTIINTYT